MSSLTECKAVVPLLSVGLPAPYPKGHLWSELNYKLGCKITETGVPARLIKMIQERLYRLLYGSHCPNLVVILLIIFYVFSKYFNCVIHKQIVLGYRLVHVSDIFISLTWKAFFIDLTLSPSGKVWSKVESWSQRCHNIRQNRSRVIFPHEHHSPRGPHLTSIVDFKLDIPAIKQLCKTRTYLRFYPTALSMTYIMICWFAQVPLRFNSIGLSDSRLKSKHVLLLNSPCQS